MVTFYPKFYLKLGSTGNSSVYIKDSGGFWQEFSNYEYFKVVKRQNQVSEFEIKIMDLEAAEKLYVKEFAEIMFFSETNLILKGRIQNIIYGTAYECTAKGFGLTEAKLLDKDFEELSNGTATWEAAKRAQYTASSAQTIANELLSADSDGAATWIVAPNTTGLFDTDYGNLSIRYEYANRLKALAKLSEAINYEWWGSVGEDYNNDYFNVAAYRPTTTRATVSQETFAITGASANCYLTRKEKDITNLANKIDILGYGDGVNQIHTSTYNASETYSTLSADISSTATTIGLIDASDFDSSGTIRIMEEQITYSGKSTNDLTGCTRGANSTTARAHKKSVYVEKYIAVASAESASSIGTNGIIEYTTTDKGLIDLDTAELVASKLLLERMNPIVRIIVQPNEPLETAGSRDIGDLITITDAESDLSDDYRIVGMTYISDYGNMNLEIEASNVSLTFIEQMQKQKEEAENLSKYMQGATNIYALTETDEGDASTYVNIRFFVPNEAVAINKVLLNFNMYAPKTVRSISSSDTEYFTQLNLSSGWTDDLGQIEVTTAANENVLVLYSIGVDNDTDNEIVYVKLQKDGGDIANTIQQMYVIDSGGANEQWAGNLAGHYIDTPGVGTFTYSLSGKSSNSTGDIELGYFSVIVFSTGFVQSSLSNPSVDLYTGEDGGSMTKKATYTADQEEVDLTTEVSAVGSGKWVNLQFRPNQEMRIEVSAYVQIFLESK